MLIIFKTGKMNIKPIKNEQDYNSALKRLELIFDAEDGTEQSDEAEVLAVLIDEYENQYYPIDAPDPIEAIKIRMEELNLKQKDLVGLIGGKSRVSEILNKRKKLTVEMIRRIEDNLQISASVLVRKYTLSK